MRYSVMIPYAFEKSADQPTLILTLHGDFTVHTHIEALLYELFTHLENADGMTTTIVDLRCASLTFDEMLNGMDKVLDIAGRLRRHPNYRSTIFVTTKPTERLIASMLARELMGRIPSQVASTCEEALKIAREASFPL